MRQPRSVMRWRSTAATLPSWLDPAGRFLAPAGLSPYLWNSATWEDSEALIPFLRPVLGGPTAWDTDESIRRAIEIRDGTIQNPAVLAFQRRSAEYPHLARRG